MWFKRSHDTGKTLYIPDVTKTADWVVDLGPEGGSGGVEILIAGTPEQVAAYEKSYTGHYLKGDVDFCSMRADSLISPQSF